MSMGCCNCNGYHEFNLSWLIAELKRALEEWDAVEKDWEETKDYITNYFKNLDVQDEINNKLDEMLENGELKTIVEQIFAEIKAEKSDKCSYYINMVELGVKNDGTTDVTEKIQEIFSDNKYHNKVFFFPAGTYIISKTLTLKWSSDNDSQSVLGEGAIFKASNNFSGAAMLSIKYGEGTKLFRTLTNRSVRGVTLIGRQTTKNPGHGIYCEVYNTRIENVNVIDCDKGFWIVQKEGWPGDFYLNYCRAACGYNQSVGFVLDANDTYLDHCWCDPTFNGFEINGAGVNIQNSHAVGFDASYAHWALTHAFNIRGEWTILKNVYCDNYRKGIVNVAKRSIIDTAYFYWFSSNCVQSCIEVDYTNVNGISNLICNFNNPSEKHIIETEYSFENFLSSSMIPNIVINGELEGEINDFAMPLRDKGMVVRTSKDICKFIWPGMSFIIYVTHSTGEIDILLVKENDVEKLTGLGHNTAVNYSVTTIASYYKKIVADSNVYGAVYSTCRCCYQ